MGKRWFSRAVQFPDDALGEDLAEFDTPLVEGIDTPDRALGEDGMLIQRDEFAERLRS